MNSAKVITLDGPAAAGKTTLAARLAKRLEVGVMNSGAMYRAATWVMRKYDLQEATEIEINDAVIAAKLKVSETDEGFRLFFGQQDITDELTTPELTREIKLVADLPLIREQLGEWQHEICSSSWKVTEGRDQGTDVFPDAAVKIFLTADFDARVTRRKKQQEDKGKVYSDLELEELKKDMADRDRSDRERPVGSLRQPEGSTLLDNSTMTIEETEEAAFVTIVKVLKSAGIVLPLSS